MTTTVGFIGLGRMGSRIARNIAKGGFPLIVHNRTRSRADEFAAEVGAEVAATPAEAAAVSDVLVSMLSDDAAVGAVYDGPEGALAAMGPGKTAMDMSTVSPRSRGASATACARRAPRWWTRPCRAASPRPRARVC